MTDQYFDEFGRYILENFDRKKPFTSFLPGIAGIDGIPLWVFYVNRGQCITSFGIGSKDFPIMEFQPANKAYRQTPLTGFRTFIKIQGADQTVNYEPFSETGFEELSRRMYIGMEQFEIEEIDEKHGLKINVLYYTIPHEEFAALVRQVRVRNISQEKMNIEMLDGMPVIVPYGVKDFDLKNMARTIEAWMEVFNLENGIPFYKVRASTDDTAEVREIRQGNFALSYLEYSGKQRPLNPIVDPGVIFGSQLSFVRPVNFQAHSLDELYSRTQRTLGQTPCAFFGDSVEVEPGAEFALTTVFGNVDQQEKLAEIQARLTPEFLEQKLADTQQLSTEITAPIRGKTARPIFDAYARQTYLDNVLRGGMPLSLPGGSIYHVYSRKHGDPERDYNYFYLAPEYYSQGNGNYRDVNQNRRSDVLFYPEVEDFSLRFFLSLIQLDGYNPLVIRGTQFTLDEQKVDAVLEKVHLPGLPELLSGPFTPGGLLHLLHSAPAGVNYSPEDLFEQVFSGAEQIIDAEHEEGFWMDHWTYNLDLIDSTLAVYPDRQSEMLFGRRDIPWYESYAKVQPRGERYTMTGKGLRQYNAVSKDEEKLVQLRRRGPGHTWIQGADSGRTRYCSSVFEKLFILLAVKSATLDPAGMGVEMEAGKPGWYDALNGLPGVLGSSVSETYEIARLASFLQAALENEEAHSTVSLPEEFCEFLDGLLDVFSSPDEAVLRQWQRTSTLREAYRQRISSGISGREKSFTLRQIRTDLGAIEAYISQAVSRIEDRYPDLPPTYFYYQADLAGHEEHQTGQLPATEIGKLTFQQVQLPPFLEGCVHAMRINDREKAGRIYQAVRDSGLHDDKLGMYKVNAPLSGVSHEIGRTVAFPPGWLENESVWLHMEYKYLLEILRSGLYEEFYADIQTALVPFQDAERYGRSPLENSSFIASSAYPDSTLHGTGFVARLSGSTAEFLTMWFEMFAGRTPFEIRDGKLILRLKPRLAHWLFPDDGRVEFTFLGHTRVVYENPHRMDTWKTKITSIELSFEDGRTLPLEGDIVPFPYSQQVREGHVQTITIKLGGSDDA